MCLSSNRSWPTTNGNTHSNQGDKMVRIDFVLCISLLGAVVSSQADGETKPDPYFEEWKENAWKRPSQCHVCRLLVTELYAALNRTDKKDILHTGYHFDDNDKGKKGIVYERSEIRLMESLENVCNHMKSYVSRARRKFPYVKGVKSHFREGLDNLVKTSKVKLNIEAPQDMIDDNTKEIIRLKFKCVHMLEEYEDDITDWYFKHGKQNLMDWLCRQRVLIHKDQGCLHESYELLVPEDNTTTSVIMNNKENDETLIDTPEEQNGHEENLDHEESLDHKENLVHEGNLDQFDSHLGL